MTLCAMDQHVHWGTDCTWLSIEYVHCTTKVNLADPVIILTGQQLNVYVLGLVLQIVLLQGVVSALVLVWN